MEKLPELGKIHADFFERVIYPRLGKKDASVIVKPQHGVDFGVIALGIDSCPRESIAVGVDPAGVLTCHETCQNSRHDQFLNFHLFYSSTPNAR